ncbi:hypothetical protein ACFL1R_05500 [Candidatus Latescibacterota bacterium]
MHKRSFLLISLGILIIIISCSTAGSKLGTGGTKYAKKIEGTEHPDFPEGVSCYVCHKEDIPEYEFHKNYGNDCGKCHEKNTWMAKKYAHSVWLLNKIHRTRCTRCHTKASKHDYNYYQCYGCHHEEDAMQKLHTDKNIDNISNCISCHKSKQK